MYFGHIAAGLAAKSVAPKASLGTLLITATALDTLSGVFLVTGVESLGVDARLGWSHGLFMSVVWSIAAYALALLVTRDRRTSLVIGLLIFSHWLLDFISHPMLSTTPDLPLLFEGSPKVGLGLYSTIPGALIGDFGLLAAGITVYLTRTWAKDSTGRWAFWAMIAFLVPLAFATSLPGLLVVLPMLAVNLLLPFGTWVDRHRDLLPQSRRVMQT
ncbi:MAG: hypothetical protein KJ065_12080 [Anaerolineae bacterium]|nr:hypothetical protein [Anaerolineae bacterium]